MSRSLVVYAVQAALGVGVLFLFASVGLGLGLMVALLAGLAVACGVWEARTRPPAAPRRWFAPWLPAVVGMVVLVAIMVARGPQGPDSGVALSIVVAGAVVGTLLFAAITLLTASVAGRMMGERAA